MPRVAPCLPGATVEEGGGDDGEYQGAMKVKIGPITASYKGTVKIQEADEANRRVAMRAQAKDARGQGTAAATITSTMEETSEGTKVHVETDMRVTGPAAQFGRGVMQDVSAKLMKRFADCLAEQISGGGADDEAAPAEELPRGRSGGARERRRPAVPSASSGISSAEAEPAAPERVVRRADGAEARRVGAAVRGRPGPRRGQPRRGAQARDPGGRRGRRPARTAAHLSGADVADCENFEDASLTPGLPCR